jgi:hypothetical protein
MFSQLFLLFIPGKNKATGPRPPSKKKEKQLISGRLAFLSRKSQIYLWFAKTYSPTSVKNGSSDRICPNSTGQP